MIKRPSTLKIVLHLLLGILFFTSCKKDKEAAPVNWPQGAGNFRIYTFGYNTFVVKEDGSLWGRGGGFSYAGNATPDGYMRVDENVLSIAVQQGSSLTSRMYLLKTDHTVWYREFQFSTDYTTILRRTAPVKITDNAAAIRAGSYFGLILKQDGTAWAIGRNLSGEFGNGSESREDLPLTKIADGIRQIAAGYGSIFLIKNDHTLWSAGDNTYGNLGYETPGGASNIFRKVSDGIAIVRAKGNNTMVVKGDGSAWTFGSNANGAQDLGMESQDPVYPRKIADDVLDVFPHGITSFFIKNDGGVWACGSNSSGQMGKGSPLEAFHYINVAGRVTHMSNTGRATHVVLLQNGNYVMAGGNKYRQLSQAGPEKITALTPFKMP